MSQNENPSPIKKDYLIPMYWHQKVDMKELYQYFSIINSEQILISEYGLNDSMEMFKKRFQIVEWLFFVCKNLNLKNETAFSAVHLFDLFMSHIYYVINAQNRSRLLMIAVACLNLACKLEEINCNYIKFFLNNLLNDTKKPNGESFSLKDITDQEMEILKTIKFRLETPNFYKFNNVFLQIGIREFLKFYSKSELQKFNTNLPQIGFLKKNFLNCNDTICKAYSAIKESALTSPLSAGIVCFRATMLALSYFLAVDLEQVNESIDSILNHFIYDYEFLERSRVVSFNLFDFLCQKNKFSAFTVDNSQIDIPCHIFLFKRTDISSCNV